MIYANYFLKKLHSESDEPQKKTVSCIEMAEIHVKGEEWGDTSGGLHKSKALESLIYSY